MKSLIKDLKNFRINKRIHLDKLLEMSLNKLNSNLILENSIKKWMKNI